MRDASSNAEALGAFVGANASRVVPDDVLDAARLCLADWVAVAIGAAGEDSGRIVRETIAGWGCGGASTVIYGGASAPAFAALANGTLAHCLDFDDTYIPAITHTSAPVWAAVLALAEARQLPELSMLSAFVTGFEIAARVGSGLGQGLTSRGLHSTGAFGRIGAAAASAAMLGLDKTAAKNALATAATQVSGLTISFGTMAKPFHAGKAAMDGVLSAELAQRGFVGAPAALAPGGLDKALIQDGSLSFAAVSFNGWEILNNSIKPYAACHLVHPAVDAVRALCKQTRSGNAVRGIRARVSPLAMQITGGASGDPATSLAAKFDLRYCMALGLEGRHVSAADFVEPWKADPGVVARTKAITASADPGIGFASAEIDVDFADGTTQTFRVAYSKGHPGNPMDWRDMGLKFDALVAPMLGNGTRELFEVIKRFGNGGSRAALSRTLQSLQTRRPDAIK